MFEEVTDLKAPTTDESKKIKLTITEATNGPLSNFQQELKDRGVKTFDLNQLVSEALEQVPTSFWEQKIDELTPLEYKLQKAMEDPEMREKIMSLLGTGGRDIIKGARKK